MIRRKKANTPLEQIFYNTKDIERLEQEIAPEYKCSIDLGTNSSVVDVADTNLTPNVEKAFILDYNGNYYKFIAFNEDATQAYIEYYATIKGAKGDTGETGATGATGPTGPQGQSVVYTTDDYTYPLVNYDLENFDTLPKVDDVVIFKNGYLAKVQVVSGAVVIIDLTSVIQLEIGKKLYQHSIYFTQNDNSSNPQVRANFTIINDDPTPLNTNELLVNYFMAKFGNHQEEPQYTIMASGIFKQSGTTYNIRGVGLGQTYLDNKYFGFATDAYASNTFINYNPISAYAKTLTDNVIEL